MDRSVSDLVVLGVNKVTIWRDAGSWELRLALVGFPDGLARQDRELGVGTEITRRFPTHVFQSRQGVGSGGELPKLISPSASL
jgi:hypothetical protein